MAEQLVADVTRGVLLWSGRALPCAAGRTGAVDAASKREGDGASPRGCYPLRWVYARPEAVGALVTGLPVRWISRTDGWCDDPADPAYNRPVTLPYPASAERLWLPDGRYDLIVVLGHNDAPAVPGLGSAIFMHCAQIDAAGRYSPTAGCIALAPDDLRAVLRDCTPQSTLTIR